MRRPFREKLELLIEQDPIWAASPIGEIAQLMLIDDCFNIALLADLLGRDKANVTRWFRSASSIGRNLEERKKLNGHFVNIIKAVKQCHEQKVSLCHEGKAEILNRISRFK